MVLSQKQAKHLHTLTNVAGTAAQVGLCFIPGGLAIRGGALAVQLAGSLAVDKIGHGIQHKITENTAGHQHGDRKAKASTDGKSDPVGSTVQASKDHPAAVAGVGLAGAGLLKGKGNLFAKGMQKTNSNGRSLGNMFNQVKQNVQSTMAKSEQSLQEDFKKNGIGGPSDAKQEALQA